MMRHLILSLLLFMTGISGICANPDLRPRKSPMGAWGYKDSKGEWKLLPVFRDATPFVGDLAAVSFDGRNYAFMTQYGGLVTDFIFKGEPSGYWNGIFVITDKDGMAGLYDLNGKMLLDKPYKDLMLMDGLIFTRDKTSGLYHMHDGSMKRFNFQGYQNVSTHPLCVETPDTTLRADILTVTYPNKQTMFIDAQGNSLVSEGLTYISTVSLLPSYYLTTLDDAIRKNNYSRCLKTYLFVASPNRGKKFGIYLMNGKNVLEPKYGNEEKAVKALAKNLSKILGAQIADGSLDRDMTDLIAQVNGNHATQASENISAISSANAAETPSTKRHYVSVKSEKRTAPKTAKGKRTATTSYYFENWADYKPLSTRRFAEIIDNSVYFFSREAGSKKYNLHNMYGEQMTADGYDEIKMWGYNSEGDAMFMVRNGKEWGLVNILGDEILAPQYEEIEITSQDSKVVSVKRDGMYYLLDGQRGRLISNTPYDNIGTSFEKNGLIPVSRLGYETKVDYSGKEHPSLGELAYNEAVATDGTPEEKVAAYGKALELCGKDDRKVIGSCYNNLGVIYLQAGDKASAKKFYEKAAGYGNSTAASNLQGLKSQERSEKWQGLSNSLNALAQGISAFGGNSFTGGLGAGLSGQPIENADTVPDYQSYGDEGASSSLSQSRRSQDYYLNDYRRWEARAKDLYESLTRQGTRTKRGDKDVSGTADGYWRQHYTGLKKNLRDAQARMRKTRQEARRDGYTIPQSNYETVSVTN